MMRGFTLRRLGVLFAAVLAASCSGPAPPAKPVESAPPPVVGSLAWAAAGPWRFDAERDAALHPVEVLTFLGLQPAMHVVEVMPGRGWYTTILAPYLAQGGGALTVATFDPQGASDAQSLTLTDFQSRLAGNAKAFGTVTLTSLTPQRQAIAPAESADLVLALNGIEHFMAAGYAEKAFAAFFAALKPGGVLGVVQARGRSDGVQDPQAGSGYVQEAYVKALAQEAGFDFVDSSDLDANAKDTKDHPFGAWTLPPTRQSAPLGSPPDESFDHSTFDAIGEPDRMVLKFRKPAGGDLRGPTDPTK